MYLLFLVHYARNMSCGSTLTLPMLEVLAYVLNIVLTLMVLKRQTPLI